MNDLSTKTRGEMVIDLMFRALRVKDAELNSLAAQLGEQLGGEPVRRMILEAAHRKNPLPYRLRLLNVIERVRSVPTAGATLVQVAQGLRDQEMLGACHLADEHVKRALAWMQNQVKHRAVQTLVVPG